MTKKYITWNYFMADPRYLTHPDSAVKGLWKGVITFTSSVTDKNTGVAGVNDARYLGVIEYDNSLKEETLEKFFKNFDYHTFTMISTEEALELANKWYTDCFSLSKDGFTLVDDRLVEDVV